MTRSWVIRGNAVRPDAKKKKKKTDCEVEEMNMKEEEDSGLISTEEHGCDC